jgi:hypothetical protein
MTIRNSVMPGTSKVSILISESKSYPVASLQTRKIHYTSRIETNMAKPPFRGNPWIRSMEDFAKFLENARESNVDPIKIAIIDDGLDATVPRLQNSIALGKSFSPYPNSSEFMKAYFVPSGRHGTLMATLVQKICPKPQLYIARLEERPTAGGRAHYTATSATEVCSPTIYRSIFILFLPSVR